MEIVIFTVVGIALYLISGQVLTMLEKLHGDPLPQRNIVFFVIIMALSLSAFSVLRTFFDTTGESPQHDHQEQQTTDGGDQPTQSH